MAEDAFVLPRDVPAWVQPHAYTFSEDVTTQPGAYGALMIRPDMLATIEKFVVSDATGAVAPFEFQLNSWQSNVKRQSLGIPFLLSTATGPRPTAAAADKASDAYDRFDVTGSHHVNSLVYHPGTYTWSSSSAISFYSSDAASTQEWVFGLSSYDPGTGIVTDVATQSVTLGSHGTAGLVFGSTTHIVPNMIFWFSNTNYSTLSRIPSGCQFSGPPNAGSETFGYETEGHWNVLNLVEALQSPATLAQWQAAAQYSVTAMSAVLRNVTPILSRGGSIHVAQIPGGDIGKLPRLPSLLYQFVSTLKGRARHGLPLETGGSWNYVPEKVQDWFFERVPDHLDPYMFQSFSDRPYCVMVWKAPAAGAEVGTTELTLTVNMCLEFETTDISAPVFHPGADLEGMMTVYLGLAAMEMNVGENPDHIQRIKETVKRIASNPTFRKVSKQVLSSIAQIALTQLAKAGIAAL